MRHRASASQSDRRSGLAPYTHCHENAVPSKAHLILLIFRTFLFNLFSLNHDASVWALAVRVHSPRHCLNISHISTALSQIIPVLLAVHSFLRSAEVSTGTCCPAQKTS